MQGDDNHPESRESEAATGAVRGSHEQGSLPALKALTEWTEESESSDKVGIADSCKFHTVAAAQVSHDTAHEEQAHGHQCKFTTPFRSMVP